MPAVDARGRWGLPAVARMAEEEIKRQAPSHLVTRDLELFCGQGGCVFYHYPLADWEALVVRHGSLVS